MVVVEFAYTTCHGTILAKRVAAAEAHHGILILATFRKSAEELANLHEGIAAIEVIAVDDAERLFDDVLAHEYSMIGSPWLHASFRNAESLGQCIERLEAEFAGNLTFILGEDLGAELLLEVLADNPDDAAKASLDGVVDAIVHDGFTIGAQPVKLFQTTVAAAHAGSKQKQCRFHDVFSFNCYCIVFI